MGGFSTPYLNTILPYLGSSTSNQTGFDNTQDPRKIAQNQRQFLMNQGNILNQEQVNQIGGDLQQQQNYQGYLDNLYGPMAQGQGGYQAGEAAAIQGQGGPNGLDSILGQGQSMYLTPQEQTAIAGNPDYSATFRPGDMNTDQEASAGQQRQAVQGLQSGLQGSINPQQLSQSQGYLDQAGGALKGTAAGVGGVLGQEASTIQGAINPAAMTPSGQFLQNYQMTPEEQQNIVTQAGVAAGTGFQAAADQMQRQALAAGEGPMGIAAYRARMQRAGAAAAGDAEANARIGASNAAAQRALTGEQFRVGAGQQLAGLETGTALAQGQQGTQAQEFLGEQQLGQANTAEQQRLAAQQYLTGANLQAATTGGLANLSAEQQLNQQQRQNAQFEATTGAQIAQAQDQASSQRAQQIANNRQQVAQGQQQVGLTANQLASNRATTVANTRLGQQQAGLGYYQGQNSMYNQNAQAGYGRQLQTYGTQGSLTNQASGQGIQASQTPSKSDKIIGGITGALGGFAGALADGGVATAPTTGIVGDAGPEWVGPASKIPWWLQGAAGAAPMAQQQAKAGNPMGSLATTAGGLLGGYLKHRQDNQFGLDRTPATQPSDQYMNPTTMGTSDESGTAMPMNEGRIVTKPTLAMIGEHEPEAVVPLTYRPNAKVRPSAMMPQKARRMYGEAA